MANNNIDNKTFYWSLNSLRRNFLVKMRFLVTVFIQEDHWFVHILSYSNYLQL